jgi:hypothetical protein
VFEIATFYLFIYLFILKITSSECKTKIDYLDYPHVDSRIKLNSLQTDGMESCEFN